MTPPGKPPRRLQSQDDRDFDGLAARRERERQREREAAPEGADQDITGRYEGAELEEMRETRSPLERVRHLEGKVGEVDGRVRAIENSHTGLKASLDTIERLALAAERERESRHNRESAELKRQADERERRRKNLPIVIAAIGTAVAGIVAAALHGCM